MRRSYLALAGLIACREPAPPPPPPSPPHDGVMLIQPGNPPLQPLRYHLTKGSKTTSRLVCDVDMKSPELSGPMPSEIVDLETTVDDVLSDGSARLRIAVAGAIIADRASQVATDAMRAQAEAMRGLVITELLAPDGNVSEARVQAGAATDKLHTELDTLLQSLGRVATRLPVEPVGIGAIWRERRTLPEGGIRAVSEITYTLTSLAGTTVGYIGAGQSTAAPQTVEQDGARIEVTDTHGRSTATGTIDLARYALDVATRSTFATTMAMLPSIGSASAGGAGSADRTTIEIGMAIRMTTTTGALPPLPAGSGSSSGSSSASGSDPPPAGAGTAAGSDQGAHSPP
jgi:hypothetical protein